MTTKYKLPNEFLSGKARGNTKGITKRKGIGKMVGYDCPYCNGSGKEYVITIRSNKVTKTKENCNHCFGAGSFTNGKPDVHWDVGVTDPSWREWMTYDA